MSSLIALYYFINSWFVDDVLCSVCVSQCTQCLAIVNICRWDCCKTQNSSLYVNQCNIFPYKYSLQSIDATQFFSGDKFGPNANACQILCYRLREFCWVIASAYSGELKRSQNSFAIMMRTHLLSWWSGSSPRDCLWEARSELSLCTEWRISSHACLWRYPLENILKEPALVFHP